MPNLLAGREIVKELLQTECVPEKLSAALLPLLAGGAESHQLQETFLTLHESIRWDADEQAAQAVMELANR